MSHARLLALFLTVPLIGRAADYYFDVNGTAPGSGLVSGGTYDATGAHWTGSNVGTGGTFDLPGRQAAVFAAGSDAFGLTYTVSGSLGQLSQGITLEEGLVTLTGGGVFFSNLTVRTSPGTRLTFSGTQWDFYGRTVTFDTAADGPIILNTVSTNSGRGGGVIKTGSGLLTITGNASASGFPTTVNTGELRIQAANALFSTLYATKAYPVVVQSGGTLSLAGNLTVANNPLTLAGQGDQGRGALLAFSGASIWQQPLTLTADTRLAAETGASLTLNPTSGDAVSGAFTLTLGGAGTVTVAKPLSGLTGLVKTDSGTAILGAVNPFPGPTTVNGGTLRFTETAGVLASVGGPVQIDATVEVVNAAAQSWSAPLAGGPGGRLLKQGSGRLTLGGSHSFGGTLAVTSGQLALGTDAAFTGPLRIELSSTTTLDVSAVPGFTLASGQTLAGLGTVIGPVSVATGARLSPGLPASLGTLVFTAPLALTGGATLVFELGTTPATSLDLLSVQGNTTVSGTNTVQLTLPAAGLANGSYPLLRTTGGTISGSVASLQLAGFLSLSQVASLQLNAAANELALVVSTNTYIPRTLTWVGDGGTDTWATGGTATFTSGGASVAFTTSDTVQFTDSGLVRPTVTLVGNLLPAAVQVSATTGTYTFTGDGTLLGSTALQKSGGGRLVLTGAHGFTGNTFLNGGTLELRTTGALGTSLVNNTATLALAPASGTSLSLGNAISGAGSLTVSGGTTVLTAANTFTGPASVLSGTLVLGHAAALGSTVGGTTVATGATLDLGGLAVGAEPLTLAGGTLRNTGPAAATFSGPLSLTAASTIAATTPLSLSGALTGAAPLTLNGPATLTLAGNSSRSGNLTVASGGLVVTGASGPGAVTVAAGATLGGSGTLDGPVTVAGTLAPSAAGAVAPSTLTVSGSLTLAAAATTTLRLDRTAGVLTSDRLTIAGTFTQGGTLLVTRSGAPIQPGDTFTLLAAPTRTGQFASIRLPLLTGNVVWDRPHFAATGVLRAVAFTGLGSREQRGDWLLQQVNDYPERIDDFTAAAILCQLGDPARARPFALAASRSLLASHRANQEQTHLFLTWPGLDLVLRYGQFLDQETKDNLREVVLTFREYKDTTTANLKMLGHVVRYLGSELYGEAAFDAAREADGVTPVTNDWRSADQNARTALLTYIDTIARNGVGEVASRPYAWKNILPLLSVGQLAQDTTVRTRARLTYEAVLAQHAPFWLRGHLALPTTRSYPDVLSQDPQTGESMGLFWYHFGGEIFPFSDSAARVAMMNPDVSPILETAASDRAAPRLVRGTNNGLRYQAWMTSDYAVFGDAWHGMNNGQIYPNGIVWTDTSSSRYQHLWVTNPIQDDTDLYVSATHGKQGRQFREFLSPDALFYLFDLLPPGTQTTPTPYAMGYVPGGYRAMVNDAASLGHIFLHYGTVLIAIRSEIPFGWDPAGGIAFPSATPKTGDSEFIIDGDTSTARPPLTLSSPMTSNFRLTVAVETASPAEFPGANAAAQLAAFRTAILALPGPTRTADTLPTATYTTRRGARLQLSMRSDPLYGDAYTRPEPLIDDVPVDFDLWPMVESPYVYQPSGSDERLILRAPDRREVFDLLNWTRTVTTGSIDVTPPVFHNVPGNLTLTADHPFPVPVLALTAIDDRDGPVAITYTPPAGTPFTPGQTTTVSAIAEDAALNRSTLTFNITYTPFVTPPAPVAPWSVRNIGNPPASPGTANHNPATGLLIMSGRAGLAGSGTTGDLWTGNNDSNTYVSRDWTGDGVFTARLASFTSGDAAAKAGLIFRETTATGSRYSTVYLTRGGAVGFQHKTATSGSTTNVNFFNNSINNRGIPEWIRLVRQGDTFSTHYSDDGTTWTTLGTATSNVMSGTALTVGFFAAPRTGGDTASVVFDGSSFLGRVGAVTGLAAALEHPAGRLTLTWASATDATAYTVGRATVAGGPYTTLTTTAATPTWVDTTAPIGVPLFYRVTASNPLGSGTASPELSTRLFTPLQIWRVAAFGTPDATGDAADLADPDRDGVVNLIEYALGGDPQLRTSAPLPTASAPNATLQLTFLRARADVTYIVEATGTLATPTTWTIVATNPGSVSTTVLVTVTDTVSLPTATPPSRYLRLRVTAP